LEILSIKHSYKGEDVVSKTDIIEKIEKRKNKMKDKYGKQVVSNGRRVFEHVKIWEDFMQVEVPFDENGVRCHIHHLDGNKKNNDIRNLACMTESEHHRYHANNMNKEHKNNISKSKKGKSCKGHKHSDETKKNMSDNRKGIKKTLEHRENIGKSHIGMKYNMKNIVRKTRKDYGNHRAN
jgi:hypothetical protein